VVKRLARPSESDEEEKKRAEADSKEKVEKLKTTENISGEGKNLRIENR